MARPGLTCLTAAVLFAGGLSTPRAETRLQDALKQGEWLAEISAREKDQLRSYEMRSNVPLRDNNPADKQIRFSESNDQAVLRSGSLMLDGLYAMAVHEARQNSVSEIKDFAYNRGEPFRLEAFETGEKWNYVWTRDLAYSVHLALAGFDPERSVSSLLFKTSDLKPSVKGGYRHQIIQDTGSGGSYPISTDRVVWALGAWETLKYLQGAERASFLKTIYPILRDTIEQDRILVYDPADGLYRGEQSFLDWREQTYPGWTKEDVIPIAMSKALSVNVLNCHLLSTASESAAALNEKEEAARYAAWAEELKSAINEHFYDPEAGLYSTYLISDGLCSVRANRYDLLGLSLAILLDVADAAQAAGIIENYPVGPHGPPVVWPFERTVPVYHNQGIWPFVTAYWIKAARKAGHADAVDLGAESLQRLAAFNLSNMENYDFVTGLAHVDGHPVLNGPVINSRRQLWSVAGFLSLVHDVVFGLETSLDGIRFRPCITEKMRTDTFASSDSVELRNFTYSGSVNTVRIHLPPVKEKAGGVYAVRDVLLNGVSVGDAFVPAEKLRSSNRWDLYLEVDDVHSAEESLRVVDVRNKRSLYGPLQPQWASGPDAGITEKDGKLRLNFTHIGMDDPDVVFNIYRNGKLVAEGVNTTTWLDEAFVEPAFIARCYTVEAVDSLTGNASHMTPFLRHTNREHRLVIPADEMKNRGGILVADHHFEHWGLPTHELHTRFFTVSQSGRYVIRVQYSNGTPIYSGITCGVKILEVLEGEKGRSLENGYLIMPHTESWDRWSMSSPICLQLEAGTEYHLRIGENEYSRNMSYLDRNENYTLFAGGGDKGFNYVNIASLHVELLAADPSGHPLTQSTP